MRYTLNCQYYARSRFHLETGMKTLGLVHLLRVFLSKCRISAYSMTECIFVFIVTSVLVFNKHAFIHVLVKQWSRLKIASSTLIKSWSQHRRTLSRGLFFPMDIGVRLVTNVRNTSYWHGMICNKTVPILSSVTFTT